MSSRQLDPERIVHTARQIPSDEARADYLDQVCGGDVALRGRVEALLSDQERAAEASKSGPLAPTVDVTPVAEGPGQQIGRFKLLQQIGEGGFGVVYMAEQSDPVRRKVALKIIKPGMDTSAVVARFEAERQALALMDHPHIARVLDGGATESGRPYFVMELVKGVPITEYCDKNSMSTSDRLELFITVCQAVQHAHQKGIIHRDIKPSNVLVTLHDGKPVVKVIDFGVAKAINQELTERTLFTAYGQMVGTPQYMSPEQAEMSGLDIDTRSDVYSLGVLLYELLTGTTPLDGERLRAAGYVELQRMIQEEEAPKPSLRLSSLGGQLTVIANHRSASPEALGKLIKGDLDWIVMKALDKDRSRRYETANGFAADIRRHLEDEPVVAHRPSNMYRFKKMVRRNKSLAAIVASITLSLALGLAGTSTGLFWSLATLDDLRERDELIRDFLLQDGEDAAARGDVLRINETIDRLNVWEPTGTSSRKLRTTAISLDQRKTRFMFPLLSGDLGAARKQLNDADEATPKGWLHFMRGAIQLLSQEYEEAALEFETALGLLEDKVAVYCMLALSCRWRGDEEGYYRRMGRVQELPEISNLDRLARKWVQCGWSPQHAQLETERFASSRDTAGGGIGGTSWIANFGPRAWQADSLIQAEAGRLLAMEVTNPLDGLEYVWLNDTWENESNGLPPDNVKRISELLSLHLLVADWCEELGWLRLKKQHLNRAGLLEPKLAARSTFSDAQWAVVNYWYALGDFDKVLTLIRHGSRYPEPIQSYLTSIYFSLEYRRANGQRELDRQDAVPEEMESFVITLLSLESPAVAGSKRGRDELAKRFLQDHSRRSSETFGLSRLYDWSVLRILGEDELARDLSSDYRRAAGLIPARSQPIRLPLRQFGTGNIDLPATQMLNARDYEDSEEIDLHGRQTTLEEFVEKQQQKESDLRRQDYFAVADFLAGEANPEELINRCTWRGPLSHAHFAIAFDYLAQGDRVSAKKHFQAVVDTHYRWSHVFWWSDAFLERIDDPDWLPWLPKQGE